MSISVNCSGNPFVGLTGECQPPRLGTMVTKNQWEKYKANQQSLEDIDTIGNKINQTKQRLSFTATKYKVSFNIN